MGAQTRYTSRSAPSWAATVGAMIESGCEVYATCSGCSYTVKPLPLAPILEKLGADYSLFDKRSRCRQPGCRGEVHYLYRPGGVHGSPFRPCKTSL
jgi:hypothetical protein